MPGLVGTVVNANVSSGMWGRAAPTYDIVWSDMQCTRRVSRDSLDSGDTGQWELIDGWQDANECSRLWHAWQIHRIGQMAARAAAGNHPASPTSPTGPGAGRPPAATPGGPARPGKLAAALPDVLDARSGPRSSGRDVAMMAREALADRIPGASFAVTCSRQHLDVLWIDGPIEGGAWRVLSQFREQGLVSAVRLRRSLSVGLIQRAIDYCLDRVFDGAEPSEEEDLARLRVTPDQYACGGLSGFLPPQSSPLASVPYQGLLRCVLARWDDARQRFVNTAQTRALAQELRVLFPYGDAQATERFRELAQGVSERENFAHRFVERIQH